MDPSSRDISGLPFDNRPENAAATPHDRPVLHVRRRDGADVQDRSWVLVPPVTFGSHDPFDVLREDCRRLAERGAPARMLVDAMMHRCACDSAMLAGGAATFESVAVRALDAIHAASTSPDEPARTSAVDSWLRDQLDRMSDPGDVVAGVLAVAESAHTQASGRPELIAALLCIGIVADAFTVADDLFPWSRLGADLAGLCSESAYVVPAGRSAVEALVTAHSHRERAVRCLDDGAPRRAAAHAAAARKSFRGLGCEVDAAGCDVLEALGLLDHGRDAVGSDGGDPESRRADRAEAVARLERARSLFSEFAFDANAAHCALVLGAIALDEGRTADAAVLGEAAYDASVRSEASLRQCALAAELVGDAHASGGNPDAAIDWYRVGAAHSSHRRDDRR